MTAALPVNTIAGALDGLALIESSFHHDNPVNRAAILAAADDVDLIVGLVTLAAQMRLSLAAAWGISEEDTSELLRGMLLAAGVAS